MLPLWAGRKISRHVENSSESEFQDVRACQTRKLQNLVEKTTEIYLQYRK